MPRFSALADWLCWQENLHPSAIDLGLDRVGRVWDRLGPRRLPGKTLLIAGTNGKGSCAALLESIYRAAGFRTGCYTSPHLCRYNERIRIQGQPVKDKALCEAFARIDAARGGESLTYFEFGTLAAADLFRRAALDVLILEVGLGGRLDAVNLFERDLALITTIGWDHRDWLGNSLEAIAREKAGILRPHCPAVIGQADPPPVLLELGEQQAQSLYRLGRDFRWERSEKGDWRWLGPGFSSLNLPPPALLGAVQYDNAAAAIMSIACLQEALPVLPQQIAQGLRQVQLPGRFQIFPGQPRWILDVAHNEPAAVALAEHLKNLPCSGIRRAVFGLFRDKEAEAIVRPLKDWVDRWYLAPAPDDRALPVSDLQKRVAAVIDRPLSSYETLHTALRAVQQAAAPEDCILLFGSFSVVGAALAYLQPDKL